MIHEIAHEMAGTAGQAFTQATQGETTPATFCLVTDFLTLTIILSTHKELIEIDSCPHTMFLTTETMTMKTPYTHLVQ